MEERWTITKIKRANRAAGAHFFEPGTMRFFCSQVDREVYQGPEGVFFVTSEKFEGLREADGVRRWTVREFHPDDPGSLTTHGPFNGFHRYEAHGYARLLADGELTREEMKTDEYMERHLEGAHTKEEVI